MRMELAKPLVGLGGWVRSMKTDNPHHAHSLYQNAKVFNDFVVLTKPRVAWA